MTINKRVLLINSHSIKENNSTSITLKSIIDFFDSENIMELYYFPVINNDDKDNNIKSIKLKHQTKIIYNIISKLYRGKIREEVTMKIVENEIKNKPSILKKIKSYVLAYDDYMKPRIEINKEIINKIIDFKPDVIYTLGSSIFPLVLSEYFSERLNIPIVLHHMDNWRETTYANSKMLTLPRRKLLSKLKSVESKMNYGMAISDEMAEIYSQVSGKKYLSLMHTVTPLKLPFTKDNQCKKINIVYAGGLHLERWKTLRKIQEVILEMHDATSKVVLNIFTKHSDRLKYEALFDCDVVRFNEFLPHNEVYKIYEMSDILVHVESFDPNIINFTKYSLSTKIPEYMSSGRPIICYAPKAIASYHYINKSNSGIAVSNIDELSAALLNLINSESLRNRLGVNGMNTAIEKHSNDYKNKTMQLVFEV